jgi:PAS domain S-box-containing protein
MKILLVDDSPAIIELYGELLREEGYEVVTAMSAIEAMKVATAEKPDIGIIDYSLPDGNGAVLTQSLLGLSETAHMLISLFSGVDHLRAALDAGAIDMISKQDPKDLFLLRVRALVRQVEQWHYQQSMQQLAAAREDNPIRVLLVDDSKAVRMAYTVLLEDSGYQVVAAGGVQDALEKAFEFQPELAIIDFHMADGTGDALVRHLLADGRTNDVMSFILTDVLYKGDSQLVFLNRIDSMGRYIRSQRQKVQLMEQLFQHIPVAMVEIVGRYVVQANPRFQAIFGFAPTPFMDHHILLQRMQLGDVELPKLEQQLNAEADPNDSTIRSWEFVSRGGERRSLELAITTLPSDQNRPLQRKLLSISDVTALTNLHRAEEQTRQATLQQQWFESILTGIPDAILVVEHDECVRQSNLAAEQMLGYSAEELEGMRLEELFSEQQRSSGLVDRYLKRKDGTTVPVSYKAEPLVNASQEWSGWVVVLHDLEELLSAESAKQASKAKDEFLASMSHELRTPLTTIIGNSEVLAESPLNDDQRDLLRAIELCSRRQLALVNDILDLSKIESGKFEINRAPFDLLQLIDEIAHIFSAKAQGTMLEFVVKQETRFEYQLLGDMQRIGQVLINLLGNAFKFASEGEVTLRVWEEQEQLHLTVSDQGIGMSQEVLERLFRPFEQADGTISRRFGGTGLGLHISKVLAELMGGEITVDSVEGEGSSFQLTIPLQLSELPVEARAQQHSMTTAYFTGRVLLAEDTPEIQILVRRILSRVGLLVETANNGREALNLVLVQSTPYDLILMDMQMPEMDGIEATATLRQLGCDTPIVALTANVMQKHRKQFQRAGCNGFLSKPIDRQALFAMLESYLPQSDSETVVTEMKVDELIDPGLRELFLNRAVELREALRHHLSREAWKEAREVAHSIKGSGATFGYAELGERGHAVCEALDLGRADQLPGLLKELLEELDAVLTRHGRDE